MLDTSSRASIRAVEKAANLAERNRGEVIVSIASTIPGRRWLYERLEAAHIFRSVYSDNPSQMAFLEGQRNQGLQLLNDITQFCPEQFIEMLREANARRTDSDTGATAEHTRGEDAGGDDFESGNADARASEDA